MDPAASEALFAAEVKTIGELAMFNGGGLILESAVFPDLILDLPHPTGARRRFRVRADDWNELAPSVMPIDAEGNPQSGVPSGGDWTGLNNAWGLCIWGTREYHQHHAENPWSNYRPTATLAQIVLRVYSRYKASGG